MSAANDRPLLAIASGHYTPYRLSFHRRIVAEIPEVRLASLVTKADSTFWGSPDDPTINTIRLHAAPRGKRGLAARARWAAGEIAVARRLWAWLERHRPAAILLSGYDELPMVAGAVWARRRGCALLIGADSNVLGDRAQGLKRWVKQRYVPWAMGGAQVMVCGELGRAYFRRYGVPDERLSIMPYEPDYGLIEGMTTERAAELVSGIGLAPGRRRILCSNRLVGVKRVDVVIDAFAGIADARPGWDLVIAGDGPLAAELTARTPPALLSAGRVRFLGFQDQAMMSALYRVCDALVLASEYEPWALVVNEAACAGLALVTTSVVGASSELVEDGINGLIVPPGDTPALRAALARVTEPGVAESMGSASRRALARWREVGDPVRGLRDAITRLGVIDARAGLRPEAHEGSAVGSA